MVYLFVLLTGAAALVYEVVWSRQLATFLGISGAAQTIVLATFMLGLAAGAHAFGAWADRWRRPLRLYGLLELGIGLWALAGLALMPALGRLYAELAGALGATGSLARGTQLVVAGLAVLPGTLLMGGTLPALARGLGAEGGARGGVLGRIYGFNTLGACAGAVAAGYLLLPRLGMRGSVVIAAAVSLVVGALFALGAGPHLGRRRHTGDPDRHATRSTAPPSPNQHHRALLAAFALSGFAALAAQLAWIRALTLVLGSSVYAISLTLATYLLGLALGGLVYARWLDRRLEGGRRMAAAALLQLATGFAIALGLALLPRLPGLFLAGYRADVQESFLTLQVVGAALAGSVIFVPTLLLGALFPLFVALLAARAPRVGADVGRAAAANGVGTVLGALVGGLVLLPSIGVQNTLLTAAGLTVVSGAVLWRLAAPAGRRRSGQTAAIVAVFAVLALALPAWDRVVMTSGPFINAPRIADVPAGRSLREWLADRNRVLFYRDGIGGTVSVREVAGERLLVIDGKTDGSLEGDRRTQRALAHLPLLLHPRPRRVLTVGLGTGMTAASAATHQEIEELVVSELSPEVVAASRYFFATSRHPLLDERLRLTLTDARQLLLAEPRPYDVILSEPSNPWITGISNLFTREFFRLADSRLAEGGLMAQWFHLYGMSPDDWRMVLRTYREVFPFVTVWMPQIGDLILVGSRQPHALDLPRVERALAARRVAEDLEPLELASFAALARMLLLDAGAVDGYAGSGPINTDDRPRLEFNAPRNLYAETTAANLIELVDHLAGRAVEVPATGLLESIPGRVAAFGVEVELRPGEHAEARWLVSWSVPRTAIPAPLPTLAISSRRFLVIESATSRLEIDRSDRATVAAPAQLTAALADRLAAEAAARTGLATLGSGQPAAWAETGGDPVGRRLALAFDCADGRGAARFHAVADPATPAAALAARLHCRASL